MVPKWFRKRGRGEVREDVSPLFRMRQQEQRQANNLVTVKGRAFKHRIYKTLKLVIIPNRWSVRQKHSPHNAHTYNR
jgi:hypothetical protein